MTVWECQLRNEKRLAERVKAFLCTPLKIWKAVSHV
jgi:G:T-mismatch repair DNA endonuclease (very short patch repair protein)